MSRFVDVTLVLVIPFFVRQLQALIVVNSIDQNLTIVPQNVDVNVGQFNLRKNYIDEIDNLSFCTLHRDGNSNIRSEPP